jgi:hypothetical protein
MGQWLVKLQFFLGYQSKNQFKYVIFKFEIYHNVLCAPVLQFVKLIGNLHLWSKTLVILHL